MKPTNGTWTAADLQQLGVLEILNSLADGAYVTDVKRRILFWNDAAERITGWPAAEVVGRTCFDNILVHVDKDGHQLCGQEFCPLHRSIVTGKRSAGSVLVYAQKKTGGRVPVEVTVAPIWNPEGQVVAGVELFRDLTTGMEDLLRARMIQEAGLQFSAPADDRVGFEILYTPNDIVGGDFYRVEHVDRDQYTVMVADVMGHGLASALYTMQLRSLWEDWCGELSSPAVFLGRINSRLHALTREAGYFATAVCVVYNAVTGEIRYVRAGHPPPLVLRGDGEIAELPEPQPALGMFDHLVYAEATARLEPGDALLLFTDGAAEITNAAGAELGLEGLKRILRQESHDSSFASVRLGRIEERLLQFSNQLHLPDDLTLLKLTRPR